MPALRLRRKDDSPSLEAWLASDDPAKQELAAETLALMGPELSLQYLLREFTTMNNKRKKRLFFVRVLYAIAILLYVPLVVLLAKYRASGVANCPWGLINIVNYWIVNAQKIRLGIFRNLSTSDDPRALPVLLDYSRGYAVGSTPIAEALLRLLPRLENEEASLLTKYQWRELAAWSNSRRLRSIDPELQKALVPVLMATYARFGCAEAEPKVKKLAEGKAKTPEAQRIQQLARDYYPRLEQAVNERKLVARR